MNLVILNSVGSVIDIEEQMVYPQGEDGYPDYDMGVLYDEIDIDWWMHLSLEDVRILHEIGLDPLPMVFSLLTDEVGGGGEVVFPKVNQLHINKLFTHLLN